ncbi:MAG: hypothetical protein C4530_01670 [Desulfobacteraceae bacterium]|nr:MAG: hypothetical protein C4530_01670 [Desulfobacteraceae bacterium]
MSSETQFSDGISRVRKLLRIRALRQVLWTGSAIFLCIFTAAAAAEKIIASPAIRKDFFYAMAVAAAFGLSLVYTYIGRKSFLDRLIDIDTRLKLQDRVSTAYEYHRLGIRSDWVDSLLADAGRCLSRLDKEELFPKRFSFVHLLFPVLILINIGIASIKPASPDSRGDRIDLKTLDHIHTMIKQHPSGRINRTRAAKPAGTEKIEKEMENLAKTLEEPSIGRKSLRRSLDRMLEEIQNEKALLSRTLAAKLEADGIEDMPALQTRRGEAMSFYQLKRLNAMLDRLFENQVPEAIAEDLAALGEHYRIEQFLEQLIDRLDQPEKSQSAAAGSGPEASGTAEPERDASDSPDHGRQSRSGGRTRSDPGGSGSDSGNREGDADGGQAGFGPEEDDGRGSGEDFSSSPGRGKSENGLTEPYALKRLKAPAVQDKMLPDQNQDYSVQIRSLTAIGKAKGEKEDVTRSYRKELEGILLKEEIPENYRTYIKNYFLSIGLGREISGP